MRKTLMAFVREHRSVIDAAIRRATPDACYFGDTERRRWCLLDDGLCRLARAEGVQI